MPAPVKPAPNMSLARRAIVGDQSQTSQLREKRKLRADTLESPSSTSPRTRSSTTRSGKARRQEEPAVSERRSEEEPWQRPKKKQYSNRQGPSGREGRIATRSYTAALQPEKPKTSPAKVPRHPADESGRITLPAEPPPDGRCDPRPALPPKPNTVEDPDREIKRAAREDFKKSGDFRVFYTLLAPFANGEKRPELGDWTYSKESERWWLEDKSTGLIIWAPTSESFL